ncbi:MAG: c-type cytochrome [Chloroflexi bacterium]|nr:c-type cytochrome [Chloroflexota bacterium]
MHGAHKSRIRVIIASIVLVVLALSAAGRGRTIAWASGGEDRGETLFVEKCKACHTVGAGRTIGPDLKGVGARRGESWLVRFITAPDRMVAQGDPVAKQLVQEYGMVMPSLGVSEEEAKALLAYIAAQSSGSAPASAPTASPISSPTTAATASGDMARGRDLFSGKTRLKGGGPACMSCHNVSGVGIWGGGTVGKDLTKAYAAFGESGIVSLLKNAPFPMMKEIYSVKQLGDGEVADVTAFLKEASSTPATSSQGAALFFIISVVGALLVIGAFQLLWRGRLSGVRRPLVKGGSR